MKKDSKNIKVGIIMGSDSDLPLMTPAAEILQDFGISYEMKVVSAHRTPDFLYKYALNAKEKGFKIIIAGAGGGAHLPGMTASMTTLPVIGVPIKTKTMEGIDSLLSIVQMPPGVPVATVAINGAKNAGLLAVEILAIYDKNIERKLVLHKKQMNDEVRKKSEKLLKIGYRRYLQEKN